ncbi:MAG: DUF3237 domain-containing protein [Acidimicrobiales bacterium]
MELRPFGTLTIQTDPDRLYLLGDTAVGQRIIQEFISARFEGDRLRGEMTAKSGADWLTVDDHGHATIDIRVLLLTHDGAHVFVTLDGRAHWPERLGQGSIYSTARLESGDERYRWVNHLPLVSKGTVGEGRAVAHEFFQLV